MTRYLYLLLLVYSCAANSSVPNYSFLTYEFPPYTYSIDNRANGAGRDIVMQVCKRIAVHCTIKMAPWRDALWQARRGNVDALFFVEGKGDQHLWLQLSEPVFKTAYGVFTPNNLKLHFSDISDFRVIDWTIAGIESSPSWYYFSRMIQPGNAALTAVPYLDLYQAFSDLQTGKINAVYANKQQGFWLLKKMGLQGRYAGTDRHSDLFFGFSKRRTEGGFAEKFNVGLADLRESGKIFQIAKKHNLTE